MNDFCHDRFSIPMTTTKMARKQCNSFLDVVMMETHDPNTKKRQRCVSPEKYDVDDDSIDELGGIEDTPFFGCIDHDPDDENAKLIEDDEIEEALALLEDLELESLTKQAKFRSLKQRRRREEEKVKLAIYKTLLMLIQSESLLCGQTHGERLDMIHSVRQLLLDTDEMDLSLEYLQYRLGDILSSKSSLFPPRSIILPCSVPGMQTDDKLLSISEPLTDELDSFRNEVIAQGRRLLEILSIKNHTLLTERTILVPINDMVSQSIERRIEVTEGIQDIVLVWIHSLEANYHNSTLWRRNQLEIASDVFQGGNEDLKLMLWDLAYYMSLWKTES